ncbi:MAG TPA: type II toxin-antitoxin system VapC family toxin [Dehalococcoidia bacterium]|nr:type II toxin-antitoxin system VapC family toxin [Dehalococcoidia bacterium]
MSDSVCIDASIVVKWLLPEADSDQAIALRRRLRAEDRTLIAPPHMPIEVTNVIRQRVVRHELTPAEGEDLAGVLAEMPILIASPPGLYRTAIDLAHRFDRPTVYDTQYVALAQIAGCDFWTADRKLTKALDNRLPFVKPLRSFAP